MGQGECFQSRYCVLYAQLFLNTRLQVPALKLVVSQHFHNYLSVGALTTGLVRGSAILGDPLVELAGG